MRLVIAISAVATLLTACSFFDAEGPVRTTRAPTQIEQATPATEDTSHISDVPSPTPRLDPDSQPGQPPLNSTPKGPPQLTEADQTLTEKRRWCKAWALDNLEPIVYAEFLQLDPLNMDDIDRTIWQDRLRGDSSCYRLYGSEPLNASNADRRNEQFKLKCLSNIAGLVDFQWEQHAEAAYERGNPTAHEIPNQYVRIMRWMHLSGEELLDMEEPPHELRKRLRDHDYASEAYYIPTASVIEQARADHGDDFSIDWWALQSAATEAASSHDGCFGYFPQIFSGRWIPRAQPPDETPTPSPDRQRGIDALHAKIQSILQSSLYLPRP